LRRRDLIPGPAWIIVKAADAFDDKTSASNRLWRTNFAHLSWTSPAA
jgi:hypothetical protein